MMLTAERLWNNDRVLWENVKKDINAYLLGAHVSTKGPSEWLCRDNGLVYGMSLSTTKSTFHDFV